MEVCRFVQSALDRDRRILKSTKYPYTGKVGYGGTSSPHLRWPLWILPDLD